MRVCSAITWYSHNSNPWTLGILQAFELTVCDSLLLWFFCKGPSISLFFSIILNSNFPLKQFSDLNRIYYVSKILWISNCFLFGFSSLLHKLYNEIVVDEWSSERYLTCTFYQKNSVLAFLFLFKCFNEGLWNLLVLLWNKNKFK